jgi:hypothetical protein
LAKRGKAFSDGSLIKECIIQAVEEICSERIDTFKNISLSANTVTRRIIKITMYILLSFKFIPIIFKYIVNDIL